MKRELTVIIPCKNEEGYIGNLLEDLNNQIGFTNLPVVVADANSTDGTRQVVERFQSRDTNLDIKIIEGGPVSVGRNRGARIADSKYLLFIDADVRLYSIETLFNTWQTLNLNPHLRLLTCRLKSYSPSILSKVAFSLYNLVHKVLVRKYPFAIGAYFFLRKEDFDKFGMFNERSDNSEDFLFSQNFKPSEFATLEHYIGQDDRRMKKMGYVGMAVHLIRNLYRYMRNGREEFTQTSNYWNEN